MDEALLNAVTAAIYEGQYIDKYGDADPDEWCREHAKLGAIELLKRFSVTPLDK